MRTPNPITTTPSQGRVSSPEKGGARNALKVSPNTRAPNTLLVTRCSNSQPARTREPLEPTDAPHQCGQHLLPRGCAEREPLPALGQPDASAAEDELQRHQHRHHLEDVRRTAGGERQCGQRHQQHDDERKAALSEQLDDVAEGLRLIATEPVFELVADRH